MERNIDEEKNVASDGNIEREVKGREREPMIRVVMWDKALLSPLLHSCRVVGGMRLRM
jgi:hypothetical protein